MFRKTRDFVRDVTALARPYWISRERWSARGLLAVIVVMNLGLVYVSVLFSNWNNRFYDALQVHDFAKFSHELAYFCVLAMIFIVVAVYQTYLNQMLQIRWRRWLTDQYIGEWLGDRAYYHLQLGNYRADNPDQRIADDLQMFVDATLNLTMGLLSSVVTLLSFAAILWHLSGTLNVPLGTSGLAIPGYMVWAALLYAIAGTWLTHRIGRPLIRLNFQQQQFEANFRFSLVRLRENTEGVALYGGERAEALSLRERFGDVVANWWAIMKRQKRLTWFTAGYNQAAIVFPVLAAAPRYFAGAIQLGGLMQTGQAFGQVQGALSWFVTAYRSLAEWKATVDRLTGFREAIDALKAHAATAGIARTEQDAAGLAVRDLELALPDGKQLLRGLNAELRPGEAVLVNGPSGTGKSTLLRAIAGIWPFGRGQIAIPAQASMLFLPQKPYLPVDTLRHVLSYPALPSAFTDAAMREVLAACGLPHLIDRLDESQNWALQLSPGEQQRIAFARALLQQPAWLFLDEATSALDAVSEARLYRLLKERLRNTTLISVGHRSSLAAFHDRRLELRGDASGPAKLAELGGASEVLATEPNLSG
jgi:vitamin B12/bleomycin/antimicrobial peptide transport system ATP-binding/permease protein